jgi:hypothetical protein
MNVVIDDDDDDIRAEIEEKIKEITNDYAAKKVHGEDIINQLIEEIDLSKDKAKDLHAIHRRVKKGN